MSGLKETTFTLLNIDGLNTGDF